MYSFCFLSKLHIKSIEPMKENAFSYKLCTVEDFLLNIIVLKFLSGPEWFPRRKFLRSQTEELGWDLSALCVPRDQWDHSSIMIFLMIYYYRSDISCLISNVHLNLNLTKMLYLSSIVHNYFMLNS